MQTSENCGWANHPEWQWWGPTPDTDPLMAATSEKAYSHCLHLWDISFIYCVCAPSVYRAAAGGGGWAWSDSLRQPPEWATWPSWQGQERGNTIHQPFKNYIFWLKLTTNKSLTFCERPLQSIGRLDVTAEWSKKLVFSSLPGKYVSIFLPVLHGILCNAASAWNTLRAPSFSLLHYWNGKREVKGHKLQKVSTPGLNTCSNVEMHSTELLIKFRFSI